MVKKSLDLGTFGFDSSSLRQILMNIQVEVTGYKELAF